MIHYSIYVVSTTPERPVPVCKIQIPKLLIHRQTAFPFQLPHKAGYAHLERDFHKHMDMIGATFRCQEPYAFPLAPLSYGAAYCSAFLSVEHLPSLVWRKNDVIFTVPSEGR